MKEKTGSKVELKDSMEEKGLLKRTYSDAELQELWNNLEVDIESVQAGMKISRARKYYDTLKKRSE